MKPSRTVPSLGLVLLLSTSALRAAEATGPLDLPLPDNLITAPGGVGARVDDLKPAPGVVDRRTLVREVRREQRRLERLDRRALERKARDGERGAQLALGADFAREAESLAFAPRAANDALSDAVRWYSLAAGRGYPGAPTLDQAGAEIYPFRIQRPRP